jgi:WD40 repeat protein/serine/threonine protein kinase
MKSPDPDGSPLETDQPVPATDAKGKEGAAAAPACRPPEQFGRYRILAEIGAGGMGTVYKAHDPQLDRVVAVKVPRLDAVGQDDPTWVRRFLREARIAAAVRHPHVCPIYDVGEHGRTPYVVMAYIDGPSLAACLRLGDRFSRPAEAARVARQVAEALVAIHARGLIHRDLKPANILIDGDGQAILTDFGLARPEQDSEHLTASGALAGTPAFMAPEQAAGESGRIGPRTDLYALGVVLYRMLAGRMPFSGPPVTVLWKIVHETPPALSELRPGLDPVLEEIVRKAMAARPEDRFSSAQDLAAALDHWLTHSAPTCPIPGPSAGEGEEQAGVLPRSATVTVERPRASTPTEEGARANAQTLTLPEGPGRQPASRSPGGRWRWVLAAAVACILVGGGLLALHRLHQGEGGDAVKDDQPGPVSEGDADPAVVRPAPLDFPAGAPLSAKVLVGTPAPLAGLRSWTIETRLPRGPVFALAYHPDGRLLAAAGDDGMIRLWETDTRRLVRLLVGHGGPVRGLAWSPRGRFLASAGDDGAVRLWEAASGLLLRTCRGHKGSVQAVAWSPDGKTLAGGGRDGVVQRWNAADGLPLPQTLVQQGPVEAVAWSPDGKLLASAGRERTVRLWEAGSGRAVHALEGHTLPQVAALAWSADSRTLASAGSDGKVLLWDVASGKPAGALEPRVPVTALAWSARTGRLCSGTVTGVQTWDATGRLLDTLGRAWSPDGAGLASSGQDGGVRLWNADTRVSATIAGHPAGAAAVAWSPDGATLALAGFGDRSLRLWDAATGQFRSLAGKEAAVDPVAAWSAGGKLLAAATADGAVHLWDISEKSWRNPLRGHTGQVLSLAWSPGGKTLASAGADGSVYLWDPATGKGQVVLEGRPGGVYALSWSPDGESLACGTGREVEIRRPGANKPLFVLDELTGPAHAVSWSPDGRALVAADGFGQGLVHFWKAGPWELEQKVGGHERGVFAAAWTGDGGGLATGGADGRVRFRDGRTGQLLGGLEGFTAPVRSLSWRPRTRTLAAAAEDGTVRIGRPEGKKLDAVLVPLSDGRGFVLGPSGQGTYPAGSEEDFVAVIQTDRGQDVLPLADFTARFPGKDAPGRFRLPEK